MSTFKETIQSGLEEYLQGLKHVGQVALLGGHDTGDRCIATTPIFVVDLFPGLLDALLRALGSRSSAAQPTQTGKRRSVRSGGRSVSNELMRTASML